MIKIKILDDCATLNKVFYIYHEDERGKKTFANPVSIVFEKDYHKEGEVVKPTLSLSSEAFKIAIDNAPEITDQMLKQKEKDKDAHIKCLESIIEKLINKDK